jgi:hypothetical protein
MLRGMKKRWVGVVVAATFGACDPGGNGSGGLIPGIPQDARVGPSAEDASAMDAALDGADATAADAGDLDAAVADAAAEVDAAPDAQAPDAGPAGCDFGTLGPADRDRVVLIGFPFGDEPGADNHEIGAFTLTAAGDVQAGGARLDVGDKPARIAFVPSGELALVLGEDGHLVSVRVGGPDDLAVLDAVDLPSADYGDLAITDDGATALVAGSNSTDEGGLSTIQIGCDGHLTLLADAFFPLRLTDSFALRPGGREAVVCGGQALFDPMDHDDLRLLERTPDGWVQVDAADIYQDTVTAPRIGLSPDGATVLIPNDSIFSEEYQQVAEVGVDGLTERGRLMGLDDPREVRFAPDGQTALLTLGEPGQVVVLTRQNGKFAEADRIRHIGLADQIAMVERGRLSGRVLLPSVDPDVGSNLAQLQIDGPGRVRDLGQLTFGEGGTNIPTAIGVQP